MKERLKALWRSFSTFSDREGRRVLSLIPLLAALSLLFFWLDAPRSERGFVQYEGGVDSLRSADRERRTRNSGERPDRRSVSMRCDTSFYFDPNTVTGAELERLGFTRGQASAILRYREAGAVFRRAEDFARCYTVSAEAYRRLEPYIRIVSGEAGRGNVSEAYPHRDDRSGTDGASGRSAGMRSGAPIELNEADSAALAAVRGIGPSTAGRIVRYRDRLGGYARSEQLREVEEMTDRKFDLISQQIRVDSGKIRKIDINFAHPSRMKGHPYLTDRVLDRILKYRQLKGGWRSIEDLTEQHILTESEAARLAPYLCFEKK